MSWEIAGATDVGCKRGRNEDAHAIERLGDDAWLLVVCDGMGGHDAGDEASHLAVAAIVDTVRQQPDHPAPYHVLYDAMRRAHAEIIAHSAGRSMGSTAVVAWVRHDRAWFGWAGDSRLYHLRDSRILERSVDHTLVADLIARGGLSEDEAHDHPAAGVLTVALGAQQADVQPTVYEEPLTLLPGDALLLCSDGLHDLLSDGELASRARAGPCDRTTHELVETANERGGHDNITVVLARYRGRSAQPEPPPPPPPARDTPTLEDRPASAARPPLVRPTGIVPRTLPETEIPVLRPPSSAPFWRDPVFWVGTLCGALLVELLRYMLT